MFRRVSLRTSVSFVITLLPSKTGSVAIRFYVVPFLAVSLSSTMFLVGSQRFLSVRYETVFLNITFTEC